MYICRGGARASIKRIGQLQARLCGMELLACGGGGDVYPSNGTGSAAGSVTASTLFKSVLMATPSSLMCFEGYGSFQSILSEHTTSPAIRDRAVIEMEAGTMLHLYATLFVVLFAAHSETLIMPWLRVGYHAACDCNVFS